MFRCVCLRSQRAQVLRLFVHFVEHDLLIVVVISLNSVELVITFVRDWSVISVVIDGPASARHSLWFFSILLRLNGSGVINNLREITCFALRLTPRSSGLNTVWIGSPLRSGGLTVKRTFLLLI